MRVIELEHRTLNLKSFYKRTAEERDADRTISEPCICTFGGEPVIIYDKLPFDSTQLVAHLKRVEYPVTTRTGGLKTQSRIFGFQPRNERRSRKFCNTTSLAKDDKKTHDLLTKAAGYIAKSYALHSPEVYKDHASQAGKIGKTWRLEGTPFTSGIVNKNNPLKYHYDAGNFKDTLSCMMVFRDGIEGGNLAVPEYGVKFAFQNDSLFMFDGQKILHGVTPIKKKNPNGYRFSVVYYSLQRMWECLPLTEELLRARQAEGFK